MSEPAFTVFVVDDDPSVLNALLRLLRSAGYEARGFSCPKDFLLQHDAAVPGCVVLDVVMPDLDGFQLHAELKAQGHDRPIIFLTGRADVPASVRAMKAGAIDFMTKPVNAQELFAAITRAEQQDMAARRARSELELIKLRLARLTPREAEVLTHVIAGRLNKQIAGDLGTVEKTIKVHRGRVMEKLGVRTIVDLVRIAQQAGISSSRDTMLRLSVLGRPQAWQQAAVNR